MKHYYSVISSKSMKPTKEEGKTELVHTIIMLILTGISVGVIINGILERLML